MLTPTVPPTFVDAANLEIVGITPRRGGNVEIQVAITDGQSGTRVETLTHTSTTRGKLVAVNGKLVANTEPFAGEPAATLAAYLAAGGSVANRYNGVESRYVTQGMFPAGVVA